MNSLIERGLIKEVPCGTNVAYVLTDDSLFLPTEYKVMLSQFDSSFVRCMKMQYNGRVELYYLTDSLKPLSTMLPSMNSDSFLLAATNLLSAIVSVKQNGFLSSCSIDNSYDSIFVDPATFKVSLIYLPLSEKLFRDSISLEDDVRAGLVKLINELHGLKSQKTEHLSTLLSNGLLSTEDVLSRLKGKGPKPITDTENKPWCCRILAMNSREGAELRVNKANYIIGKNPNAVDGVLSFNKMISRIHCRISQTSSGFTVCDLASSNGTYLNGRRLQPQIPYPLEDGDILRLANSDFQVIISRGE